ncbi:hypothetical protein DFP73DRAFT_590276 [Morchella snyderi]|nr:hypothetical protein DFP73DRAFT_590276 [Morchella snyderi]
MDLTSLSSTLPRSNPSNEDTDKLSSTLLLAAFKQTALSVTTLYKTAANEAERSRREGRVEGYQDCIDDLLLFLEKVEGRCDKNSLETMRQWALSRRRKAGGTSKSKSRREDREESVDSEELPTIDNNVESVSPQHQQQNSPSAPQHSANNSPPRPVKPQPSDVLQQTPVFSFRADMDLPRHVPAQPRFDNNSFEELPDTELYSPPTSPTLSAHNPTIFQNRAGSNTTNPPPFRLGSPTSTGRHPQQRTGNKRRIGTMADFFDFPGVEKMQFESKRRRHQ